VNTDQKTVYAVVDGKQRLETILKFVRGDLSLPADYGDVRYNGKKWDHLGQSEREVLWNYVIPVEFLTFDVNDTKDVSEAFDRLNRNMRKLEAQELRHARWDGWFIGIVENECEQPIWQKLGIVTKARSSRMKDAQFISELLLIMIAGEQLGFDQDMLDDAYAKYDDLEENDAAPDEDAFKENLENTKTYLAEMQDHNGCIKTYARQLAVFYTLWAIAALHRGEIPNAKNFAHFFSTFMEKVRELDSIQDAAARAARVTEQGGEAYKLPLEFLQASKGASTDLGPRERRLVALRRAIREA
jgi:hypothetical protein